MATWLVLQDAAVLSAARRVARSMARTYQGFEEEDLYQEAMILLATKAGLIEPAREGAYRLLAFRLRQQLSERIDREVRYRKRFAAGSFDSFAADGLTHNQRSGTAPRRGEEESGLLSQALGRRGDGSLGLREEWDGPAFPVTTSKAER